MGIPVVDHNNILLELNSSISASELFSTSDPDGDAIDFYFVQDFQPTATGGFFELGGSPQPNGSRFRVEASELSTLTYRAGSNPGFEGFRVIAVDVNGQFSSGGNFARINSVRPTNLVRPIVQDISTSVVANESIPITDLLSAFDPDGFPITRWFIRDRRVDNSFLTIDGVAQPQGEYFFVNAEDLDRVAYNAFGSATTEQFDKFAFDGALFSNFSTSEITVIPNVNHAVAQSTRTNVLTDDIISLKPFSVVTDDDGNTIKFFEFRNTSPHLVHGDLILDGVVQPRQEWIRVSPEQLNEDRLTFQGGETDFIQQIRFRGNDGRFNGFSGTISIDNDTPFEVFTTLETPGLIFDQQLVQSNLTDLFTAIGEADIVSYQLFDARAGARATGRFEFEGTPLGAGIIHEFTAEQVESGDLVLSTGDFIERSTDDFYVRTLNDVGNFSQWERLTVRTEPEFFDSISSGVSWLTNPNIPFDSQGRLILSYSFLESFPTDAATGEAANGNAPENFTSLTDEAREAVGLAFETIEAFTNINFVEVADSSTNALGQVGGIWRFGNYGAQSNAAAFAFFPSNNPSGGDIYFNRFFLGTVTDRADDGTVLAADDPTLTPGSPAFTTLLHEMMHALGYSHVFEAGQGTTILPEDTRTDLFSVLSTFTGVRDDGLFPTTPQLYDIEAIQRIYGANFAQNAGDDVYNLATLSFTGGSGFAESLWDGGGNDTLSLEGSNPSLGFGFANVIDLRAGGFSTINGIQDSVSLPLQSEFENAIGSDLTDTLIGNHFDNSINGGLGNDLIDGQAGDDFLVGGAGNDRFIFGVADGDDVIDEQRLAGRDTIELANFANLDTLEEDLRFRLDGRDLVISLHLDDQEAQDGTLRITNQIWGGSRIETIELNGSRIDLVNLTQQATAVDQQFEITAASSVFGQLVAPV